MTSLFSGEHNTENDNHDDRDDYANDDRGILDLPPEHLAFQTLRIFLKFASSVSHLIGLVLQIIQFVLIGDQFVHIFLDAFLQIVHVGLCLGQLIEILGSVELVQKAISLIF